MSKPIVELASVSHIYERPGGDPFRSLDDVSFSIEKGAFTAVLGRSGSGKSTLLNLIAGLDRASDGSVTVAGQRLEDLKEAQLARWRGATVGIVFQFFQLLPTLTIKENLLLAMELVGAVAPADRGDRADELLSSVAILDQADKLPSTLSGGQQQRAAIARALANRPTLLLADEPTGNLDTQTAEDIVTLFETLADDGVTVVMVTHDQTVAARANRLLELVDGRTVGS